MDARQSSRGHRPARGAFPRGLAVAPDSSFVIGLVALLALGAGAAADPRDLPEKLDPVVTYRYYAVQGATAAELRADLSRKGPYAGKKRFDANTSWHVSLDYERLEGEPCRPGRPRVRLVATHSLPRWDGTGPPELVACWQSYMAALEKHERGHLRYPLEAAEKLRERMLAIAAEPASCEEALEAANAAWAELRQWAKDEGRRYDLLTRHGERQGAVFPLPGCER